jgi:hypothetical protein
MSRKSFEIPYFINIPEKISIDIDRQLYVDNFLIDSTSLTRVYYVAIKIEGNPLFKPETATELDRNNIPVAAPFNDGLWYDYRDISGRS